MLAVFKVPLHISIHLNNVNGEKINTSMSESVLSFCNKGTGELYETRNILTKVRKIKLSCPKSNLYVDG